MRQEPLLSPFYKWGNRGTRSLGNRAFQSQLVLLQTVSSRFTGAAYPLSNINRFTSFLRELRSSVLLEVFDFFSPSPITLAIMIENHKMQKERKKNRVSLVLSLWTKSSRAVKGLGGRVQVGLYFNKRREQRKLTQSCSETQVVQVALDWLFPLQDKLKPTLSSVAPYLTGMQLVSDQSSPQAALPLTSGSVEGSQPLQDLSF